jgi:hypothetical protein
MVKRIKNHLFQKFFVKIINVVNATWVVGKCNWCRFLHPGVNDTGNYNFLEVKDSSAKFSTAAAAGGSGDGGKEKAVNSSNNARPHNQQASNMVESAWERGLRFAKEMKEKALKRKQAEAKEFDDKKMNISLKDIEDEKENYERHVNIERKPRNDLEDDDLGIPENFDFNQLKRESQAYGGWAHRNSKNKNVRNLKFHSRKLKDNI